MLVLSKLKLSVMIFLGKPETCMAHSEIMQALRRTLRELFLAVQFIVFVSFYRWRFLSWLIPLTGINWGSLECLDLIFAIFVEWKSILESHLLVTVLEMHFGTLTLYGALIYLPVYHCATTFIVGFCPNMSLFFQGTQQLWLQLNQLDWLFPHGEFSHLRLRGSFLKNLWSCWCHAQPVQPFFNRNLI
jgi:hypothetical protein